MTELPTHTARSPLNPSVRPRLQRPHRWWRLACASIAAGFVLTGIAVLFACATLGRPAMRSYSAIGGAFMLQTCGEDTMIAFGRQQRAKIFVRSDSAAVAWLRATKTPHAYRRLQFAGFAVSQAPSPLGPQPSVQYSISAKKWAAVVFCTVGASLAFVPLLRSRRRAGHCLCSYDLTGNTSGICPECGKGVVVSAATCDHRNRAGVSGAGE